MMKKMFLIGLALAFPGFLFAQFQINTEIRPRTEYRNGYKQLAREATVPAFFTSQRSRISLNYAAKKFSYAFSVQDVRVWGDEKLFSSTGVVGDAASLDVHEAWLELKINPSAALKIGRQVFKYDDERLLGARNWNQNAITYDALLFKINNNLLAVDVALSVNNETENTFGNSYNPGKMKTLNFIHLRKKISPALQTSVVAIASGYTPATQSEVIYVRSTLGTYLAFAKNKVQLNGSAYFQTGKNSTGKNVSASLIAFDGTINLKKLTPGAGLAFISGQDALNTDPDYQRTDHAFDILYGRRHGFYGALDYFSNLPKATKGGGLIDLYFQLSYFYTGKNSLQVDYHWFALQNRIPDPANPLSSADKYLGSEVDLTLNHQFNENVNLKGGYSFMLPGETMEKLQGIPANESEFSGWGWVMLTFKQRLFKSE